MARDPEYGRQYYLANKERLNEAGRARYYANREVILENERAKRAEDPERRREQEREANRNRSIEDQMLNAARSRARKGGYPCTLVRSEIVIPEVCPLLGIPIFKTGGRATNNSPSLDKIVPELGYVTGNIWVVSHLANLMKHSSNLSEWRTFCVNSLRFLDELES